LRFPGHLSFQHGDTKVVVAGGILVVLAGSGLLSRLGTHIPESLRTATVARGSFSGISRHLEGIEFWWIDPLPSTAFVPLLLPRCYSVAWQLDFIENGECMLWFKGEREHTGKSCYYLTLAGQANKRFWIWQRFVWGR
jgi:hypothetical protein